MRYLILMLVLGFFKPLCAEEFLPKGCHALPQGDDLKLTSNKGQLFFIHSLSRYEIWLANPQQQRFTTSIVPGLWSVFYAPKFESSWRCIQSEPGHEQKVACQQVLAVCQWSVKAPDENLQKNNAWQAYNMRYSEISAYLQRMGWQFKKNNKSD